MVENVLVKKLNEKDLLRECKEDSLNFFWSRRERFSNTTLEDIVALTDLIRVRNYNYYEKGKAFGSLNHGVTWSSSE